MEWILNINKTYHILGGNFFELTQEFNIRCSDGKECITKEISFFFHEISIKGICVTDKCRDGLCCFVKRKTRTQLFYSNAKWQAMKKTLGAIILPGAICINSIYTKILFQRLQMFSVFLSCDVWEVELGKSFTGIWEGVRSC